MNMINILWVAFIIKHFICDFPLQKPRHFMNKGKYGHIGGLEHALIHGIGSLLVLLFVTNDLYLLVQASIIDFFIHYNMDWFKMWWISKKKYTAQDEMFWTWFGIDQMIHYLTYAFIIGIIVRLVG